MSEPVDCYGCGHPMHHPWAVYEPVSGEQYCYCIVCEFWRWFKGIDPGDHEKGEVSNGTRTMRRRSA